MKITNTLLKKVEKPEKGYKRIWDSDIPGFGARIYPNGKITFVYLYRLHGQAKQKQFTIGRNLSLYEARQIAATKALLVAEGKCPLEMEKQEFSQQITFNDLVEKYKNEYLYKRNSEKTIRDYLRYLVFVSQEIGTLKLKDVSTEHLLKIQLKAKEMKGKRSSNVILTMLKRIFSLATDSWDLIEKNPCSKIKKYQETPRTSLLNKEELGKLQTSIDQEENIFIRSFFHLLIHSVSRRGELANMKWQDIDLNKRIWIKPNTKTGEPHLMALNDTAIKIINSIPRVKDNPYVFVGRKEGKPINGFSKFWKRINTRAGITNCTIHDIRRSVGSLLLQSGKVPIERVSQILGHKSIVTTEKVYARLGLESKEQTVKVIDNILGN